MKQVASVNKNTIVVVNSVGPILVEQWINHPNGEQWSPPGPAQFPVLT